MTEVPIYLFAKDQITLHVPVTKGVYILYNRYKDVIYYGKTDVNLYSRILAHYKGDEGSCTQDAKYFSFRFVDDPSAEERSLLSAFKTVFGKLPKCNDQLG